LRAIYYSFNEKNKLQKGDIVEYSGSSFNHLMRVVRVRAGEEILLMDGKGTLAYTKILDINKNKLIFEIDSKIIINKSTLLNLGICLTKREYLDEIIRKATEIGFNKIFILNSDYSQKFKINFDRLDRIIKSAGLQSNNPFWPEIRDNIPMIDFLKKNSEDVICFNNREIKTNKICIRNIEHLLIGPEGGFSKFENDMLDQLNVRQVKLPTPILKSSTAITTGFGYIHGLLSKSDEST